jgi:imidazolonepropionase-like amidohydrolase
MRPQFTTAELQLIVDRAHAAGVAVTAHAHGTPAVEQAVAVGVDGIEHCSCVTDRGFGQVSEETVATLARSRIAGRRARRACRGEGHERLARRFARAILNR